MTKTDFGLSLLSYVLKQGFIMISLPAEEEEKRDLFKVIISDVKIERNLQGTWLVLTFILPKGEKKTGYVGYKIFHLLKENPEFALIYLAHKFNKEGFPVAKDGAPPIPVTIHQFGGPAYLRTFLRDEGVLEEKGENDYRFHPEKFKDLVKS